MTYNNLSIKKILYRNSNLLKKNNLKSSVFFNNLQIDGGKTLKINYKNNDYIFETSDIDEDHYILFSQDGMDECINILISKKEKVAEIHGIKSYKSCLYNTNQKIGSNLLKLTLKFLKEYNKELKVKTIVLKDNSVKHCNKINIKLPIMMILLTGDTWYGSKRFRPFSINAHNKYELDKILNEKYENNKNKLLNLKISDFDFIKYINLTKNDKLINTTKYLIKEKPLMLLKDYLFNLLKEYDNTCIEFSKFYEKLYTDISLFDPIEKTYGLTL